MSNRRSKLHDRRLEKFFRAHGLEVLSRNTGHKALARNGSVVYVMSNHPQGPQEHVADNTIKDLVRLGHLPAGVAYKGKTYRRGPEAA